MRETRTSGSEGGGALIGSPYPYRQDMRLGRPRSDKICSRDARAPTRYATGAAGFQKTDALKCKL